MSAITQSQSKVKLPDTPAVYCWALARAIAEAVHPDRRSLHGPKLITQKRVRPVWNPTGWEQRPLDPEDCKLLESLQDQLPLVHAGMSEEEKIAFAGSWEAGTSALFADTTAKHWEPIIPSDADLYAERVKHLDLLERSLAAMRVLVSEGKLRARRHHVPCMTVDTETELPRQDALAYLEWINMEAVDATSEVSPARPGEDAGEGFPVDSESLDVQRAGLPEPLLGPVSAPDIFRNGLQVRWTPEEVARAEDFKRTHTWAETEKEFGCRRQRLTTVFERERERLLKEGGKV